MSKMFDELLDEPQTDINVSGLNPAERMLLRSIEVTAPRGRIPESQPTGFTTVYYLEGDEFRAVKRFVDENKDILEKTDFSKRNAIQQSMDRELYDLLLDIMGERAIKKLDDVVTEERRDGTIWIVDREAYDNFPMRRYSTSEASSARYDEGSLRELFDSLDETFTREDLREAGVQGNQKQVMKYFLSSPDFDCERAKGGILKKM